MRNGFVLPGGTATEQLDLAVLAEQAGWDGIFVFEVAYGIDPWGLLAAVAARTTRIMLGTMLTPLPWRRPWKVASQVVTLDQLSGGRAILAVAAWTNPELPSTGEVTDLRGRAERLDEGIDLIRELWAGRNDYHGEHYVYRTGQIDAGTGSQAGPGTDPDLGGRRVAQAHVHAQGAALRRDHSAVRPRRPGAQAQRRARGEGLADRARSRGRTGRDLRGRDARR